MSTLLYTLTGIDFYSKHTAMKKKQAIKVFGSASKLARGLGYTRGWISQWCDELTQKQSDMIVGAAIRLKLAKSLPDEMKKNIHESLNSRT